MRSSVQFRGLPTLGTTDPQIVAAALNVLSATPINLAIAGTSQITAVLVDFEGDVIGGTLTYTSRDASVATVSASGLVTGVLGGTTYIDIRGLDRLATVTVVVSAPQSGIAAVVMNPVGPISLVAGVSFVVQCTVDDASGNHLSGKTVVWASANTSRFTVSADDTSLDPIHQATVHAVAVGIAANLTATAT